MWCARRTFSRIRLSCGILLSAIASYSAPVCAQASGPSTGPTPNLSVQIGHIGGYVWALTVSPDGERIYSGGGDGEAVLWDRRSRSEIRRFHGHTKAITSLALSADEKRLFTASWDGTVRTWDTRTGQEIRARLSHPSKVRAMALSPSGRLLATGTGDPQERSSDYRVRLWNVDTGALVAELPDLPGDVRSLAFSSGGDLLFSGSDRRRAPEGDLTIWDVNNRRAIKSCTHARGGMQIASMGDLIAFGARDGRVYLAQVSAMKADCQKSRTLLALDPLSKADEDEAPLVTSIAYHAQSRSLAAGSSDGRVAFVDLSDPNRPKLQTERSPQAGVVWALAFGPGDRGLSLFSGGEDQRVYEWEVARAHQERTYESVVSSARRVLFTPDRRGLIVAGEDGVARLWDLDRGHPITTFAGHRGAISSAALSSDGRFLLTGGRDKTARLWNVATGALVWKTPQHDDEIRAVAISPRGDWVATTDSFFIPTGGGVIRGRARLWRLDDGKEREIGMVSSFDRSLTRHFGEGAHTLAFSPDGTRLATGGDVDKTARLWDLATGDEIAIFSSHQAMINAVEFVGKDELLTVTGDTLRHDADDFRARAFKVGEELVLRAFKPMSSPVVGLSAPPRLGVFAVVAEDGDIAVFSAKDDQPITTLTMVGGHATDVALSGDGRLLATVGDDGVTRIFDVGRKSEILRLISLSAGAWAAIAPDGRFDLDGLTVDYLHGLSWVMNDHPFAPLSLELFMRDYFEPGLVPRVIGEPHTLPPIRPLATLNRYQPRVTVHAEKAPVVGRARVTVTVGPPLGPRPVAPGQGGRLTAHDLRLFRDGQLIATRPKFDPRGSDDDLESWRASSLLPFDSTGHWEETFDVALPRGVPVGEVEFRAHVFNDDRVRSQAYLTPLVTSSAEPRRSHDGRRAAHLLAIGVGATETNELELSFAPQDARMIHHGLKRRLTASPKIREVKAELMISIKAAQREPDDPDGVVTPTKKEIQRAIARIAATALPEDLVVVSISSHGIIGEKNELYLVPFDGAGSAAQRPFELMISARELASWLSDIDAGEIVVVIDACRAGAAVGANFKPAPLGDRSLGQLVFDKRMRMIMATQGTSDVISPGRTGHSLLTHAIVVDGLELELGSSGPAGTTFGSLFRYAESRVPALFLEHPKNGVSAPRPVVLDFWRGEEIVLPRSSGKR